MNENFGLNTAEMFTETGPKMSISVKAFSHFFILRSPEKIFNNILVFCMMGTFEVSGSHQPQQLVCL